MSNFCLVWCLVAACGTCSASWTRRAAAARAWRCDTHAVPAVVLAWRLCFLAACKLQSSARITACLLNGCLSSALQKQALRAAPSWRKQTATSSPH